ncbi:ATP-binding cassette domain-containing protein [Pseudomonas sp. RTB3]|nr:ATP-binding cassette domain-containing protein [Pseudomonas sp. RTB3]
MIVVEKLTKQFNGQVVLNGIDLEVKAGEVVAIIGPSGSGKSTFLRCLNFLEEPTSGKIIVGDIEIDGSRTAESAARLDSTTAPATMGFVFQNFNLLPPIAPRWKTSCEAPLHRASRRLPREARHRAMGRKLLAKVGLAGKEDAYPRRNCPVVSNSVWRLPEPWPWSRTSCCSMSRPRPSTRSWSAKYLK